jgi:hypothetical protein
LIGNTNKKIGLMKTKFFIIVAAFAIFSLYSCTKEQTVDQASIDFADDEALSDAVFDDVFNTVDNADIILDNYSLSRSLTISTDTCPLITISPLTPGVWPKTITIDFGTGCTGLYDNTRSGKIIIEITGPRMEEGSVKTVTFENYYFNGIKVEGTKVIENMGYNNNLNLVFSVQLMNGKLTLPEGQTIQRSFQHQREWTAGIMTRNIWDDEFLISGTSEGQTINGLAYKNTIMNAIRWQRVCRFAVSGTVSMQCEDADPIVIDYGNGDCDDVATVTRNGETKQLQLKFRHRFMMGN